MSLDIPTGWGLYGVIRLTRTDVIVWLKRLPLSGEMPTSWPLKDTADDKFGASIDGSLGTAIRAAARKIT